MSVVLNLFTDKNGKPLSGFEHGYNAFRTLKKKRVHYKNTTYTKSYKNDKDEIGNVINDDVKNWELIRQLYIQLANYFYFNALGDIEEVVDYGIVRVWTQKYTSDTYAYTGIDRISKIFKGQDFIVREAELIGSEDLGVQERIFLHQSYLDLLEQGENPNKLNTLFDAEIQFLKTHTLADLLACLIFMEVEL